jgi:IS30 family transposase
MATVSNSDIRKVRKWYLKEGLSVNDIAKKLHVTSGAVFYFMRRNGIKRRKIKDANALRFLRQAASFSLKKLENENERSLKVAGVMLYWAEGSKWDGEKIVDFANSDKDMIQLFLRFLREICGIEEKKLRVFCYFHKGQNVKRNMRYWSRITGVPLSRFSKPYIRLDSGEKKIDKMPYGMVHIRYGDKKLLCQIREWIEEYKVTYIG